VAAKRTIIVVILSGVALACGSKSGAPSGTDGGDAALSSADSAAFTTASDALAANEQVAKLADDLFDFDPTIDPKNSPSQNANAIGSNARSNLGMSCGKVSVAGAGVTVAFGAPPGCTLANGDTVSGSVTVALSRAGSTTSVGLTLTDVVYDGVSLSGTASFATTNGSTFTVKSSLTSSTGSESSDLTVTGGTGSFSITGTATVTMGSTSSALTFSGVTVTKGQCYATAGSLAIEQGGADETLTFDSGTPETGKVSVQVGKLTTTATLPAYGSCPSG